jgi:sporulation protein YlmC with PRC-barrel domain
MGGRNATNAFIYDTDSLESPYSIGVLTPGQSITKNYLKNFTRTSVLSSHALTIATANATDYINNNLIEASSNSVSVLIPARSGSASFVLDKIASFYNLTNETFIYNITLKLTNKGGSNATNVNITDLDYNGSNFTIGELGSGESAIRSYLLNFTRNSTTYYSSTATTQALGIDSYSNNLISANSTSINLTIPSSETGQQLTVIKNVYYNNQTSTSVNYTLTVQVINSGGVDLTGISVLDLTDLSLSTAINLNRTESYSYSGSIVISKAQSNAEHLFSIASATVNLVTYNSTQTKIIIPGYGNGPNDLTVDAPASVTASTAYSTTITIVNMNPDIGQDFTIDYWVTNTLNTTNYSIGSKTLFVAANSGSNSTIVNFNSPSTAGTYIFMAKVRESGKEASDSFEVASASQTPTTPSPPGGGDGGGIVVKNPVQENKTYEQENKTYEIVCNPPYIRHGKECCLDVNGNLICDEDEKIEVPEQNKIKDEETPKKESQFLNNIKSAVSNIGNFFSLIGKSMKENKNYLFIGFGILMVLAIMAVLIKVMLKKTRKKRKEPRRYRKKIKENLKKIKGRHFAVIILSAFLIYAFFMSKNNLTGFVTGISPAETGNLWIIILILVLFAILAFIIYGKSFLKLIELVIKHKNKYTKNSIKGLMEKKVYTESGHYLGKIKDVVLGENKINTLKIKLSGNYKIKGISISYRNVKAVGYIVIIEDKIIESLERD